MRVIREWTATPSGGALTVVGLDATTREERKLVGVKRIAREPRRFGIGYRTVAYNGAGGSLAVLV